MFVYRLDESLWRRLDLAAKVIPPETLGRIIDRGTVILRLARAEVCFYILIYLLSGFFCALRVFFVCASSIGCCWITL
jgi:hypothetical protein